MAPPFRELTPAETDAVVAELAASNADIVWVGLGMPRQEKWMHQIAPRLPGKTLVGVGAAFDLLSGTVPQAPPALQRAGLEWAFRLWQEPRRLWRRYVLNNPLYLVLAAQQLIRYRLGAAATGRGLRARRRPSVGGLPRPHLAPPAARAEVMRATLALAHAQVQLKVRHTNERSRGATGPAPVRGRSGRCRDPGRRPTPRPPWQSRGQASSRGGRGPRCRRDWQNASGRGSAARAA